MKWNESTALRDLEAPVASDVFDGEVTTKSFEVAADCPHSQSVEVAPFDLGDLTSTDADAFGELRLCESGVLTDLAQAVGTHLGEHARLVGINPLAVPWMLSDVLLKR